MVEGRTKPNKDLSTQPLNEAGMRAEKSVLTKGTRHTTPGAVQSKFDGRRSIAVSLYMCLVGYGVLVGIPVISTAWVGFLGFTEQEVGRVAGADLGGLSLGAVLAAMVVRRVNRRLLVLAGLVLAVAANTWWPGEPRLRDSPVAAFGRRPGQRHLHSGGSSNAGRRTQSGAQLYPDDESRFFAIYGHLTH